MQCCWLHASRRLIVGWHKSLGIIPWKVVEWRSTVGQSHRYMFSHCWLLISVMRMSSQCSEILHRPLPAASSPESALFKFETLHYQLSRPESYPMTEVLRIPPNLSRSCVQGTCFEILESLGLGYRYHRGTYLFEKGGCATSILGTQFTLERTAQRYRFQLSTATSLMHLLGLAANH
jgi:hypothetical protein